jgi:hypothetical protein
MPRSHHKSGEGDRPDLFEWNHDCSCSRKKATDCWVEMRCLAIRSSPPAASKSVTMSSTHAICFSNAAISRCSCSMASRLRFNSCCTADIVGGVDECAAEEERDEDEMGGKTSEEVAAAATGTEEVAARMGTGTVAVAAVAAATRAGTEEAAVATAAGAVTGEETEEAAVAAATGEETEEAAVAAATVVETEETAGAMETGSEGVAAARGEAETTATAEEDEGEEGEGESAAAAARRLGPRGAGAGEDGTERVMLPVGKRVGHVKDCRSETGMQGVEALGAPLMAVMSSCVIRY